MTVDLEIAEEESINRGFSSKTSLNIGKNSLFILANS